ncbi:Uncharacterized protein FWK35_00012173, partial [Aphis craccivora]
LYFNALVNIQNKTGLHLATKIRLQLINYNKEKMRDQLAMQLNIDILYERFKGLKLQDKNRYDQPINANNKESIIQFMNKGIIRDHSEMFFSVIRSKGGFNNNPTVTQFEAALKLSIYMIKLRRKHYEYIENIKLKKKSHQLKTNRCAGSEQVLEDEDNRLLRLTTLLEYITGFVVKCILKRIQCEH